LLFKVRARNSDSGKGKSGGYRIIYWIPDDGPVLLVTIYSKSEQGDVRPEEIRRILADSLRRTELQTHPVEQGQSRLAPDQDEDVVV